MLPDIKLSKQFKNQAIKAILSIVLFVIAYLIMLVLAIGLTVGCISAGLMLIITIPRLMIIILGLGIASLGILVLVFLIKFIFTSHKTDRSNMVEIKENDEPALFCLIKEIATEVGTSFPKRVYLSSDINAGVFYDHSFLSMFFPIKKNLKIGLGLVNTVSVIEFKAILAHEFGHFSQKTMTVGSYIYNVNQIIYNMLYENGGYSGLIQGLASIHGIISIFVIIAVKIVQGIQWIAKQMYKLINICYMSLSREMEFHADEIAAHITGGSPLISSLIRMDLAESSLQTVIQYYEKNIPNKIRSKNIYKEQFFVMDFEAREASIPIENDLPQIPAEFLKRFNKSKLVIKDQWASHPELEERISRLKTFNTEQKQGNQSSANSLFSNIEFIQKKFTENLFENVNYKGQVKINPFEQFKSDFLKEKTERSFDKLYNGYYDHKNPEIIDFDYLPDGNSNIAVSDLFSKDKVDLVYILYSLQRDVHIIEQVLYENIGIKSFDYDGKKYETSEEAQQLIVKINEEINKVKEKIKSNDILIIQYFKTLENCSKTDSKLIRLYENFYNCSKEYDSNIDVYNQLRKGFQTIRNEDNPINLGNCFTDMKKAEEKLKAIISQLLKDERLTAEINPGMKANFEKYISLNLAYADYQNFLNSNLDVIFNAMSDFDELITNKYFSDKKELLCYQASLQK